MTDELRPWPVVSERVLGNFRIFTLRERRCAHPVTGHEQPFFVLDTADWCNIVALTAANEVVLVRQPRAGSDSVTLEIPGGMVDPGEEPATAAARELCEETGFVADSVESLGVIHPNPAMQSNRCHLFVAHGVTRTGIQSLDPGEQIEVVVWPLERVWRALDSGEITHALVVAALGKLQRYLSTSVT